MARTGRPPFVPSAEQRMRVEIMVGCGMSQELICQQTINPTTGLPCDPKTLRKVFKHELENGTYAANSLVAQALFKKATGTGPQSVTAAIFWMKARAGWKDKQHIEVNGNIGDKPTDAPTSDLTDDQLAEEMRKHGIDPSTL